MATPHGDVRFSPLSHARGTPRLHASIAWCGLLGAALACGSPEPPRQATPDTSASAAHASSAVADSAFAPFDSVTLEATCRGTVTPAEDSAYRARVSGVHVGGRSGVLVYAAPTRQRRCYQLGVVSADVRDSIVAVLRRAGVPDHVVTYFHLTEVPPDDIDQGAPATPKKAP
jgi:hypothetical protein